jgi:geranylgeranyl diphosphate synthase type I
MSKAQQIKEKLKITSEVDVFIERILKDRKPIRLYEASKYIINAGGKRLRPYLTIKSCEAAGGTLEDVLPFAAALELLHNFTLIHDDVMDNDELRRGSPTVHIKYGEPLAILAGDLLFSKVYQSIMDFAPPHISGDRIINILRKMTDAVIQLCEGQALDIIFPYAQDVSDEDYILMIGLKTSALFKACAEIGAIAAGASDDIIESFGKFAWNAGIAFQIADDILGITTDESAIGKPFGSDIREGKKTLLMIHALKKANQDQRSTLLNAMKGKVSTRKSIDEAIKVLEEVGSIKYARKVADDYLQTALQSIKNLNDVPAKRNLIELTNYFVQREY